MKRKLLVFFSVVCLALTNNVFAQSSSSRDSDPNTLDINNTLKDNFGNDLVTIYPNPARSELNVIFDSKLDIRTIAVYNLIGKVVSVFKVTSGTSARLDIDNIPSGIYFIRLTDSQGKVAATCKFTRQ